MHLARHFASLPPGKRLERTLVFVAWPGHMAGTLPQAPGWVAAHPDIVKRAVAAVTIEHLGSSEWLDSPGKGYHGTGANELYVLSVTQGPTTALVRDALAEADLAKHTVVPAPGITVGAVFHEVGVPHVGGIAGPTYLLVVSENGELDKLDAELAARETGFYADVIRRLAGADAAELRSGDPTLGTGPMPANDQSTPAQCGPEDRFVVDAGKGRRLAIRVHGLRQRDRSVLVTVAALGGETVSGVTVELRRGDTVLAHSAPLRAGSNAAKVLLRRSASKCFARRTYTIVVRRRGKLLEQRTVRLGG